MTEAANSTVDGRQALLHAALSDVGLRRGSNQDSYAMALAADGADWARRGHLLMVADGMGAHAAGELASKLACESIPHTYRKSTDASPVVALRAAVANANANIHERGQANAEFQGMGTTCSVLVLLPRHAIAAHVGDSRIYRLRAGKFEQLTFDHSLVWEMMAAGQMPRGDVANFIPKNIITRSLGPHADVQIDVEGPYPLEPGDTFLLCSDGLSGQLKDEEIGALLSTLSPEDAVRVLIDVANLRGGPDNITAIVARVQHVPDAVASEEPVSAATPPTSTTAGAICWSIMAACLALGLVLALTRYYVAALVSVLVGAASAAAALVQSMSNSPDRPAVDLNQRHGTGPHAAVDCTPNANSVAAAAQLANQLRDATHNEHWTLDWGHFNSLYEQAQQASQRGEYADAMRNYALSISFMLGEIRRQAAKKGPRDSSVLDS